MTHSIPLAESDLFWQKMTIKTKKPLESNLSSIQEDFSLSAFSAFYRYIFCCFIPCHRFCCFLLVCFKCLRPILKLRLCYNCKFNRINSLHAVNAAHFSFCLIRLVLFHVCSKLLCLFYGDIRTVQDTGQQPSLCLKRFLYQLCL